LPRSNSQKTDSGRRRSGSKENRISSSRLSLEEIKARESRSREDELKYFAVEATCPRCKKKVKAHVLQLHEKVSCPHCRTVMHMGPDGRWHEGPPPTNLIRAPKITRWHRLCRQYPILRNRRVQWSAGLGSCLILTVISAVFLLAPRVDLPPQLNARTRGLCSFLLKGEYAKFKQCLVGGTKSDAADWYDNVHTVIEEYRSRGFIASLSHVETLFQNDAEGLAQVKVVFRLRPAEPAGEELELTLFLLWRYEPKRGWLLDGTRTLELMRAGSRA